ncbi:MAG: bacteriohemerythrin [Gammaproteobacteria bacterium]|nr:bacteriohemerythrin [Gammaproteobacteria bacterium]
MDSGPALAFDDAFVTGIEVIDVQHRNLINLANEAAEALSADPSPAQVRSLVRELLSYAIYHFRTEEQLMQEYGYVGAESESHIARHRDFSARVVDVQEKLQRCEYVDTGELVEFLADWIRHHILGTDQDLAAHILRCRAEAAHQAATPLSPRD